MKRRNVKTSKRQNSAAWPRPLIHLDVLTFRRLDVFLLCVLCVSAVNLLVGCQTGRIVTSDGMPPAARPFAPPVTPLDAKANPMAFFVGQKPDDTNGNGYPDLISVTVLLFAEPHPSAIRADGAFVFTLFPQGQISDADVKPIGSWRMEGAAVEHAQAIALGGPCYQFQLSMLDASSGFKSDKLPLDQADLICQFIPADGSPAVRCDGVRTIQIGRRLAGGAAGR